MSRGYIFVDAENHFMRSNDVIRQVFGFEKIQETLARTQMPL